ncbi:hypothetical protein BDY24DRAFT_200651 [Mrakia frigida]|uniref:uncharacterized protein n=1 Tax=Mrakia frigida TaxID=29902 RepID=UPI003FCC0E33
MSSSAISPPPTESSSMALLAAAATAGTGSEPSSGSEGGQQLITKHLAPVKRGGRTKRPSTKAQQALADSTSQARPSSVPRTPSAPSQPRAAPPPAPPSHVVHHTPPAQFTPAQPQQYSQQQHQGPPSAGWEPRTVWEAPGSSSSSSMSGGPYPGGAQFYEHGHPSSSTTPSHLVPQQMQSTSQPQHYYHPSSHPLHYVSSPSYVDRSVSPYPLPPRSNHSHSSSNGQLFSPSLHGPYSNGPPSHYSGGLPIASSPAAPSPLNHYPPPLPLAYPSHFVSSSTPLQPFHPHPPPLPSLQQRASTSASPAPSKTSVSSKSAPKDKDGTTPKKTPRKYTKKADYWVENGGQGRKGPGKKVVAGTSVSSAPSFENGLASFSTTTKEIAPPTPPPSGSTPVPSRRLPSLSSTETLVAKTESVGSEAGGELARLRSEEEEEEKAKEEKRPGWLKRSRKEGRKGRGVEVAQAEGAGQGRRLDLWQPKTPVADNGSFASSSEEATRTSGSPPPNNNPTRLISPLSPSRRANKPTSSFSSIPRTVSAPTLLTSSDGKASLSSTQILASEMAWLVPLHPRHVQPNTSSTSIFVEEDEETKLAREEKKRRRLLAFQKDGMDFFASPETERTRSLSRSQSSSNLVAARVVGVGRVAMGAGTLSAMEEAGTAQKVSSPTKGKGKSVERPRGRITRPNWPENVYPWGEPEREKIEALGEERKITMSTVQRYLESSDDDDSEEEQDRFPANPLNGHDSSSAERIMTVPTPSSYMELSSSRRGGKSSYGLIGDNIKRTRVRSVRSFANLGPKSFDPSDARQALLLKRQASSTFSMSQFRHVVSKDLRERRQEEQEEDDSAVIGCICREEIDGDGGMVECDSCQTWHHLDCIGLDEEDLEAEWFCWKCAPGEQLSVPYEDEEPLSTNASSALLRTPNLQSAQPNFTNNSPSIALSPAQSLALAPSPMFGGRTNGGTPIQRFGTPRLVSSSSYSSAATTIPGTTPHPAQSPQSSRPRHPPSHDFGDSIGLGTPSSGPSRSSWDSGRNLSTPKFGDFDPADDQFFDLTSTPSRHLGRELPFGGTPNSRKRSGPGAFGRLAFTTPSQTQEFFHGLQASPRIPSTSGPTPSLDHYPSSVDSSGPLSPYQPSARWSAAHPSPSVYGQNRQASASRTSLFGGEGTTPRARMISKSAMASEPYGSVGTGERRVREHVRFGEPLGDPMKEQQQQQRGLVFGMGQEEFGAEL